ncbi:hypothetical protein [Lactobacillus plantarum] [Lactiplantibacillus mudanjiangensis]|nr:hypothetical protein [Lactobacillus plantarum] [Lactiplantibacillus mudanjiangensis]
MGYMLYAYNSDSLKEASKNDDEQIQVAKELNAKYIRLFLETDNKYFKDGKYKLNYAKIAVNKILKAGMIPILTFSADRITDQNSDKNYKKNINILKKEISQAVTEFKKTKVIWESINEANSTVFWFHMDQSKKTTVKNWTGVNNFMKKKVHDESPDAIYLSGAYATAYKDDPKEMLANLKIASEYGMANSVDAISIHPYNFYAVNGGRPETTFNNGVFDKIKENTRVSKNRPLVVSEYGYNSSDGVVGKWQGIFSEKDKANNLVRETLLLDAHKVPLMIIYELEGSGFELASNGSLNESGQKMKELMTELGKYTFYRSVPGEKNDDYFYEYRNGKKRKVVYWTSEGEHSTTMFNHKLRISGTPQYLKIN